MTLLDQVQLLFTVSRPLSWIIAPSLWFSGLVHSGTYVLTVEGLLFAVALSFPICLSKSFPSLFLNSMTTNVKTSYVWRE
jgi:hypothetical protein